MKQSISRLAALGVTALLVSGAAVGLGASGAAAASPTTGTFGFPYLGKLKLPATGDTNLKVQMDTFSPCPAGANRIKARIDNNPAAPGPADKWTEVAFASSTTNGLSTTAPMSVPSSDTLQNTAAANSLNLIPGNYAVTLICGTGVAGSTSIGEFDGVLTVGSPNSTYTSAAIVAPATTATSIGVSPASPQTGPTAVTITATIAPAGTGSVDFFDGATKLNVTPVAVSAGSASFTSTLAAGSHPLTARYTSDDVDNFVGSISSASTFQVNAPAGATTASLAVNPASGATTADSVTLTATVTPSNAVGSVQFFDNAPATPALLGTVALSGGTANFTPTPNLAVGTYKFQAKFVPTNPANFDPATSVELAPYAVSAFAGASATETLLATIGAGALTITAGGPPVDLGTAVLNAGNDLLVTAPTDLNTITVTDTRAGNIHWTASGQVSDFVHTSDPSKSINGENLGWTPKLIDASPGQNVIVGPVVAPGHGVGPGVVTGVGLKSSHELAHTSDGSSIGTAHLSATVVLQAPTSTPAGTYQATLTLTAI